MAEDREHGFTTREEWQSFFHAYFQRIDEINELAFAITVGNTSFEDWLFPIKNRHRPFMSCIWKIISI